MSRLPSPGFTPFQSPHVRSGVSACTRLCGRALRGKLLRGVRNSRTMRPIVADDIRSSSSVTLSGSVSSPARRIAAIHSGSEPRNFPLARAIHQLPEPGERLLRGVRVGGTAPRAFRELHRAPLELPEEADQRLAVVTERVDRAVENLRLLELGGVPVSPGQQVDFFEVTVEVEGARRKA